MGNKCDILLKIVGEKSPIVIGGIEKDSLLNDSKNHYEIIEEKIKSLVDENKQQLSTILKKSIINSGIINIDSYTENGIFIKPNISSEELKQKFPDIKFPPGLNKIKVLLVNNNSGFTKFDTFFSTRVVLGNNDVFVVPVNNIKSFSNYLAFIDTLDSLSSGTQQLSNVDQELLFQLFEDIKDSLDLTMDREIRLNEGLNNHINKILEKSETSLKESQEQLATITQEINRLNTLESLSKDDKANLKKLLDQQPKLQKKIQDLTDKINHIKDGTYVDHVNDGTYRDAKAQEYLDKIKLGFKSTTLNNRIENLRKKLEGADLDTTIKIEQQINEYKREIERLERRNKLKIDKQKYITSILEGDIFNALKLFINHQEELGKLLPQSTLIKLYDVCQRLLSGRLEENNTNPVVASCLEIIKDKHLPHPYIALDDFRDLCIKQGWISQNEEEIKKVTNSDLLQLLKIKFFKAQTAYVRNLGLSNTSRIYLNKHLGRIENLFPLMGDQIYGCLPILDNKTNQPKLIHGKYLFKISTDEGNTWNYLWSDSLLSHATEVELFESEQKAIDNINSTFPNQRLIRESTRFLTEYEDSLTSVKHTNKYYKRGEIIKMLDFEYGPHSTPNITVEQLHILITKTFNTTDAKKIIKELDSIDKLVAFYSYMADDLNWEYTGDNYKELSKKAKSLVEKINESQYRWFEVIEDSTSNKNDINTLLVEQDVPNLGQNPSDVKQQHTESTLTYWKGVQSVFKDLNIPMELVNKEQLEQMGEPTQSLGFMKGGIIYINTDKAKVTTPLHEYSHILLGLIRHTDEKLYKLILDEYISRDTHFKINYEHKFNIYKERYNLEGDADSTNPNYEIVEELFADAYSEYLSKKAETSSLSDVFKISSKIVAQHSIFETLSGEYIQEFGNQSISSFFNTFSERINIARQKIGNYNIPATEMQYKKVQSLFNKIDKDAKIVSNLDTDEIGILKMCE